MNWDQFAARAPELAALAQERFEKSGVCLIGTLRRDGSPRISPMTSATLALNLLPPASASSSSVTLMAPPFPS